MCKEVGETEPEKFIFNDDDKYIIHNKKWL